MLLIISYSVWYEFLKRLVRARTVGYLFLIAIGQSTSHHAAQVTDSGERVTETNCLNSLLHRLSSIHLQLYLAAS